jgi:hypothetical protein
MDNLNLAKISKALIYKTLKWLRLLEFWDKDKNESSSVCSDAFSEDMSIDFNELDIVNEEIHRNTRDNQNYGIVVPNVNIRKRRHMTVAHAYLEHSTGWDDLLEVKNRNNFIKIDVDRSYDRAFKTIRSKEDLNSRKYSGMAYEDQDNTELHHNNLLQRSFSPIPDFIFNASGKIDPMKLKEFINNYRPKTISRSESLNINMQSLKFNKLRENICRCKE